MDWTNFHSRAAVLRDLLAEVEAREQELFTQPRDLDTAIRAWHAVALELPGVRYGWPACHSSARSA